LTNLAVVLLRLGAILAPLVLLGWLGKIYPRRRLMLLAIVPAVVTLGLLVSPSVLAAVLALDGLLLLAAVGDLFTLPRRRNFTVVRHAGRIVSLRKPHPVTLALSNLGRRALAIEVRDGVPHELNPDPAEFSLKLTPHSRATLHYKLRPSRRGAFHLDLVDLRVASFLGLWQRALRYPAHTLLHVYPDMQQLSQYALLARTNRLSLLGVRRVRRIGQDHEFERLRDYTLDDNYRQIDWRATARRSKLTVKDFQATQSQRIVFLVDCGRMMTNTAEGLSLLDHALNAVLLLSYVALRQGDSPGLICFSDEIHGYVPPRSGMRQMNRLLHASFDRFPRLVESRYDQAFRYLATHCRRRSLVVLITNLIDEVNARQIDQYLANLVGRHLPLGVLLRDRRTFEAVEGEPMGEDVFWRAAAAADILLWRHQVLTDLQSKGVLVLDTFPQAMTAPLINRYLQVKARHLL